MKKIILFSIYCLHAEDPDCVNRLLAAIQSPFPLTEVQRPNRLYTQVYYEQVSDEQGIFKGCDFSHGSSLKGKNLQGMDLEYAHFEGADLTNTKFISTRLHGADFTNAHLEKADFSSATSEPGVVRYTDKNPNNNNNNLSNTYHIVEHRKINDSRLPKKNITFDGANLRDTKFINSVMTNASFNHAYLENSNFYLAQLNNSDFSNAHIDHAIFRGANLTNTNFLPLASGHSMLNEKEQEKLLYLGIMAYPMIFCCTKLSDHTQLHGFNVTSVASTWCTPDHINHCIKKYEHQYPAEFKTNKTQLGDMLVQPSQLPSWFRIIDDRR